MACPICSGMMEPCFTAQVLGKYPAQYETCNACGFLRVHEPHWLDEAYSRAIAAADTGLAMRNISLACKLAGVLYWVAGERGEGLHLDAAGGYGMLTRLMRDLGFDFYWADKYCDNLLAPGFEYSQAQGACRVVTAMEVLEHLTDPAAFIEETLAFSGAQTLVFTTELYEGHPPQPDAWWYYTFSTGQHIGFFSGGLWRPWARSWVSSLPAPMGSISFQKRRLMNDCYAWSRGVGYRLQRRGGFADAWGRKR